MTVGRQAMSSINERPIAQHSRFRARLKHTVALQKALAFPKSGIRKEG